MPQLEQVNTYLSQLVWLAITFTALYLFLRFVILPGIGELLERRHERIRVDLDKASDIKEEAERVRQAYEQSLAEGRGEAQRLIREAAAAAARDAAARQEEAATRIAAEIDAAEARIDQARAEAIENVRQIAGDLARDVVDRLIGIKVDEQAARAVVDPMTEVTAGEQAPAGARARAEEHG